MSFGAGLSQSGRPVVSLLWRTCGAHRHANGCNGWSFASFGNVLSSQTLCTHSIPPPPRAPFFSLPLFLTLSFSEAGHLLCPINQCSLIRNLPSSILWMASHSKSQKLPHNCCSGIITSEAAPLTRPYKQVLHRN